MATISEDKLIKNYYLLIALYEAKEIEKKKVKIKRCLENGADVNLKDMNNNHNTPLHIAVQKGEKEIVQLLIDKGAESKEKNLQGKSALNFADDLNDENNRTEILTILITVGKELVMSNIDEKDVTQVQNQNAKQTQIEEDKKKEFLFTKRVGTSGICGQLYETKLLCLVLLNALKDHKIKKFYLGTNISGIGALDDICIRYELEGQAKPIMVFVQAKHREDPEKNKLSVEDVFNETGDFSLSKYFDSYLHMKERFQPDTDDDLFKGELNNVECNFIIYTPAKDNFNRKRKENEQSKISNKVSELIETVKKIDLKFNKKLIGESQIQKRESKITTGESKGVFQYAQNIKDVSFLTKMIIEYRIRKLGQKLSHIIMHAEDKWAMMMDDKFIKRCHVVLGNEVLVIEPKSTLLPSTSKNILPDKTETKRYHNAKFRPDFFTSKSEFLICLREAFFVEISSTKCDNTKFEEGEVLDSIENLLKEPCASNISKAISKIVIFNVKSQQLEIIDDKIIKNEFKGNRLHDVEKNLADKVKDVGIIKEAVKIKLKSIVFKVPTSFGNLDMTIRGTEDNVTRRLDKIAEQIVEKLLKSSKIKKLHDIIEVEINDELVGPRKDQLTKGFLDINGGIGGAVGNVLIQDEITKIIKFDTINKLPPKANEFLQKMLAKIDKQMLERYRIKINIDNFPRFSFAGDEYDTRQAEDFLNKLWFFTDQGKENDVEIIIKEKIIEHYNHKEDKKHIRSDAIFLIAHDAIQKWWLLFPKAPYLTLDCNFFEKAEQDVFGSPLLTLLHSMYIMKLKQLKVLFNETSINALQLNNSSQGLINIITEANIFSGIKIMQHFQNCDSNTFMDFDYVHDLPLCDYKTMISELESTKIQNLIIMCETYNNYDGLCKLKQILRKFKGSCVVIATNEILAKLLKNEYATNNYQSVHDKNTQFKYLNEDSQTKVLNDGRVIFQGEELPLSSIIDQKARGLIRTKLLCKLLKGETIETGLTIKINTEALTHISCSEISKDFYVSRYSARYKVDTLNDITDMTVLVSSESAIENVCFLSHLCLNTKLSNPLPWLVIINLQDHDNVLKKWHIEERRYNDDEYSIHFVMEDITFIKFVLDLALKNNKLKMYLKLTDGKKLMLTYIDGIIDPVALFEIELFIYLYNEGKIIFIFNDLSAVRTFDEEVLKILRVLRDGGQRLWITKTNYIPEHTAIEQEFGTPYELENIIHFDIFSLSHLE